MFKIYVNFEVFTGVSGGANSFLRNLIRELQKRGVSFVNNIKDADIIFLNATQHEQVDGSNIHLNRNKVLEIHKYKKPIIHRKTTNLATGLSKKVNGIAYGDNLQLSFNNLITHHIFQSKFSLEYFQNSGFSGNNFSLINNGVDTNIFNFKLKKNTFLILLDNIFKFVNEKTVDQNLFWRILSRILRFTEKKLSLRENIRKEWKKEEVFKGVITTWSNNPKKINPIDLKNLDIFLSTQKSNYEVTFIGHIPKGISFECIKNIKPMSHTKLSEFYKKQHFYIMFNQNETYSNAALEALACGLPIIYKVSGSNRELVDGCGKSMTGNWEYDLKTFKNNYSSYYNKIVLNHSKFSINRVADDYINIFSKFLKNKCNNHH